MEALIAPFDPDALVWASVPGRSLGGEKMRTSFPWDQLEAFIVSEQSKGWCTFTTECQLKRRTAAELLAEGKQIRKDTPLFQCTWRCGFGGQTKLRRSSELGVGAIPPAPEGKHRRSKSANGESIKQPGCLCR